MGGDVDDLLGGLIDRGYNRAFGQVLRTIRRATGQGSRVDARLSELDDEAERLYRAGERLTADNAYVTALLADLSDELARDGGLMDAAAVDVQAAGIDAGLRGSRVLALGDVDAATLERIGVRWNSPDPEQIEALVGYVNDPAWRELMAGYPDDVMRVVENQIIRSGVEGWSPRRTARAIREKTINTPAYQAEAIARTLHLESYRTATAIAHRANADIADRQVRIGSLDDNICLCCLALHGEEMQIGSKVADHFNGRCTSVLIVRGYPEPQIVTGPAWFDGLPESRQLEIAGPGALEALQSGRARLRDFAVSYSDALFGEMVVQGSIDAAIRNRRNIRYSLPTYGGDRPVAADALDGIQTEADLIEWLIDNERTTLGGQFWDDTMQLVTYDEQFALSVNRGNVRESAKRFVRESMDFQYGKDYLVDTLMGFARDNGIEVGDPEEFYNQQYAYQAHAILAAARIGNVRLTEPQRRRLNTAVNGNYLDMVYNESRKEAGSLANAVTRGGGNRLSGAELEQARANFRDWVLGLDG